MNVEHWWCDICRRK